LNSGRNATFKVDLPSGPSYSIRLYHSNPLYFGSVQYNTQPFNVIVEGTPYAVPVIAPGTTFIQTLSGISVSADGVLEIVFGAGSTAFVVAGIDISAPGLPVEQPLSASGDPRDEGAAAISLDLLQPVAAEAAARWSDVGLTPAQAATLANVQFAVADLGGAYLGLANSATNTIRIDDDAAMMGWSLGKYEVGSAKDEGIAVSPFTLLPTNFGVDLLTVVMHELGHLLGHEHSDDDHDLMAPVLAASPLGRPALDAPLSTLDSSVVRRPWSVASGASSRADDVFADLGQNGGAAGGSELLESGGGELLAELPLRSGERATEMKIPRRSRMERFERELDAWFAELAAVEDGSEG
jgi:hypothetical protein